MVVWYYDADMAEDANLTEGDMHLTRTPISTPRGAWVLVPSPHHVPLLCCLLQGVKEGKRLRIGLLVALGECHGA